MLIFFKINNKDKKRDWGRNVKEKQKMAGSESIAQFLTYFP